MSGETIDLEQPGHAFDNPEFREFLNTAFPQYAERLDDVARPGLSASPDELEQWEAERILARKQPFNHESHRLYLHRLLYEEAFSVNQKPGLDPPETIYGVAGMTPGGLISHRYPEYDFSALTVGQAATLPEVEAVTFSDAVKQINERDWKMAHQFIDMATQIVRPEPLGFPMRRNSLLAQKILTGQTVSVEYETIAFRLLKMLHTAPEMLESVHDKALQLRFMQADYDLPRAQLLQWAWGRSQPILPDGYYTSAETPEVKTAVDNLFALRTHPEMQVFFRHLSPSGYMNDARYSNPND